MPSKAKWLATAAALAAVLLVIGVMGVRGRNADGTSPGTDATKSGNSTGTLAAAAGNGNGPGMAGANGAETLTPEQKAARLQQLQRELALAEHTYTSYKAGTKYPQESRPISEHPDQIYPNRAVEDEHALHKKDGSVDPAIKIRTSQSRIYVGNQENVVITISAIDKDGTRLPVFVNSARAKGLVTPNQRPTAQLTVSFNDSGNSGDAQAGDGISSATITPATTGFANFSGTVRTEVNFNVGDSNGYVNFDFIYTPETPATWTGAIRDVLENGSLNFYLKANINQAGRYLVSGRLDDASGKPFALVSFNDVLNTGQQEIRLQLFGKLVLDQKPAFPLTLRDVNGYLLKENTDPDRALMPRLAGNVYVSKKYPLTGFSGAEWDSEERNRYLTEYNKDVELARTAINQLK